MFDYTNITQDGSVWTANCTVDKDLLCLKGHFPNKPILPAIAQLEMLEGFVSNISQSTCMFQSAAALKFMQPILPLDDVILSLDMDDYNVKFTVHVGDKLCTKGKFVFRELA